MPNLIFPFFMNIELNVLPEIRVKRKIMLTIIEVLTNISKTSPFIVSDGMLIRKSKKIAKEAMKKAKKTYQESFRYLWLRKKIEDSKNTKESIITYASVNSVCTIEKGKTNRPEREGKLIPHIRKSKNKYM
jgi:hypothetical protein